MILLGKKSHELNDTAAKYLDQNSTAGYFDGLSNPAARALKILLSPKIPERSRRVLINIIVEIVD